MPLRNRCTKPFASSAVGTGTTPPIGSGESGDSWTRQSAARDSAADAEIARKKAEQLAIEEEKIRKEKEAWQTKLDAMHTDDENYQKRGCRESGVSVINALVSFFSTLGEPPKEGEHPGGEEKEGGPSRDGEVLV